MTCACTRPSATRTETADPCPTSATEVSTWPPSPWSTAYPRCSVANGESARAQVHRHLRRYMNWIPAEYVDALAPTTGWAGSENELLDVLHKFEDIGTDEVHLIPTSSKIDQLRRVANAVKDFG